MQQDLFKVLLGVYALLSTSGVTAVVLYRHWQYRQLHFSRYNSLSSLILVWNVSWTALVDWECVMLISSPTGARCIFKFVGSFLAVLFLLSFIIAFLSPLLALAESQECFWCCLEPFMYVARSTCKDGKWALTLILCSLGFAGLSLLSSNECSVSLGTKYMKVIAAIILSCCLIALMTPCLGFMSDYLEVIMPAHVRRCCACLLLLWMAWLVSVAVLRDTNVNEATWLVCAALQCLFLSELTLAFPTLAALHQRFEKHRALQTLAGCLETTEGYQAFMSFANNHYCSEPLLFTQAISAYQRNIELYARGQELEKAISALIIMWETYFASSSPYLLNVDNSLKDQITQAMSMTVEKVNDLSKQQKPSKETITVMCRDMGHIFDDAIPVVMDQVKAIYNEFQQSDDFARLRNEYGIPGPTVRESANSQIQDLQPDFQADIPADIPAGIPAGTALTIDIPRQENSRMEVSHGPHSQREVSQSQQVKADKPDRATTPASSPRAHPSKKSVSLSEKGWTATTPTPNATISLQQFSQQRAADRLSDVEVLTVDEKGTKVQVATVLAAVEVGPVAPATAFRANATASSRQNDTADENAESTITEHRGRSRSRSRLRGISSSRLRGVSSSRLESGHDEEKFRVRRRAHTQLSPPQPMRRRGQTFGHRHNPSMVNPTTPEEQRLLLTLLNKHKGQAGSLPFPGNSTPRSLLARHPDRSDFSLHNLFDSLTPRSRSNVRDQSVSRSRLFTKGLPSPRSRVATYPVSPVPVSPVSSVRRSSRDHTSDSPIEQLRKIKGSVAQGGRPEPSANNSEAGPPDEAEVSSSQSMGDASLENDGNARQGQSSSDHVVGAAASVEVFPVEVVPVEVVPVEVAFHNPPLHVARRRPAFLRDGVSRSHSESLHAPHLYQRHRNRSTSAFSGSSSGSSSNYHNNSDNSDGSSSSSNNNNSSSSSVSSSSGSSLPNLPDAHNVFSGSQAAAPVTHAPAQPATCEEQAALFSRSAATGLPHSSGRRPRASSLTIHRSSSLPSLHSSASSLPSLEVAPPTNPYQSVAAPSHVQQDHAEPGPSAPPANPGQLPGNMLPSAGHVRKAVGAVRSVPAESGSGAASSSFRLLDLSSQLAPPAPAPSMRALSTSASVPNVLLCAKTATTTGPTHANAASSSLAQQPMTAVHTTAQQQSASTPLHGATTDSTGGGDNNNNSNSNNSNNDDSGNEDSTITNGEEDNFARPHGLPRLDLQRIDPHFKAHNPRIIPIIPAAEAAAAESSTVIYQRYSSISPLFKLRNAPSPSLLQQHSPSFAAAGQSGAAAAFALRPVAGGPHGAAAGLANSSNSSNMPGRHSSPWRRRFTRVSSDDSVGSPNSPVTPSCPSAEFLRQTDSPPPKVYSVRSRSAGEQPPRPAAPTRCSSSPTRSVNNLDAFLQRRADRPSPHHLPPPFKHQQHPNASTNQPDTPGSDSGWVPPPSATAHQSFARNVNLSHPPAERSPIARAESGHMHYSIVHQPGGLNNNMQRGLLPSVSAPELLLPSHAGPINRRLKVRVNEMDME
eukprot:g3500.t1